MKNQKTLRWRYSSSCIRVSALLLSVLLATQSLKAQLNITRPFEEALEYAKSLFEGQDVDYYKLDDGDKSYWTIFVDAEPMKGWEHDCYVVKYYNKTFQSPTIIPYRKIAYKMPPAGEYTPIERVNRYGDMVNSLPRVPRKTNVNSPNPVAERTYAIILSGGIQPTSNYPRYWNDCSFIYQTLTNTYGIPKSNIIPIIADGNDPAEDTFDSGGHLVSQSLDLDFDGFDEIELGATKDNIANTLSSLVPVLQEDDHLFFYVIDHGGSEDGIMSSYICLWGSEKLFDYELAEMLKPFSDKYVNINVVLGQCFSGGFLDDLSQLNCVVATASAGNEPSYGSRTIPYDEFVYRWTCAVNGADHLNNKIYADSDKDGMVCIEEAFKYAQANDVAWETPQYGSFPTSIGEDLAFNHLAPAIDLYIKDNEEDTGKVPNLTTDNFWTSPDIWVRNSKDGKEQHENPIYSEDHDTAYVYLKVHNRGKKGYEGGSYMHLYWALAATGFRPETWMGNELSDTDDVTGSPVNHPLKIPPIKAGMDTIMVFTWGLPDDKLGGVEDNYTQKHHFCLLAKIMDTHVEPWYYSGTFDSECKKNNKNAQKNVSIIKKEDINKFTNVFIRNSSKDSQLYTLELRPVTTEDERLFSLATVEMEMSQPIYDAWSRGGFKARDIANANSELRRVEFTSKDSRLEAVSMQGSEFDKVGLRVRFNPSFTSLREYALDLIQRDSEGNIIGGERFIIESQLQLKPGGGIIINSEELPNGYINLWVDKAEEDTINWLNEDGDIFSRDSSVYVTPRIDRPTTYSVSVFTSEEEMLTDSITIDSLDGISEVLVANSKSELVIRLKRMPHPNSRIILTSLLSGEAILSVDLDKEDTECRIDISSVGSGIYSITYSSEGVLIDSQKVQL